MSKNFRSSFIDLLCCRYSKRHRCRLNGSLRNRRATGNFPSILNSKLQQSDYMIKSSPSRYSQKNATTGLSIAGGDGAFSSSSRLTMEASPKSEPPVLANTERKLSIDYPSSCQITVGTQTSTVDKPHRRRKHSDRSPVVAYSSLSSPLTSKTTEMLCT